MSRGQDQILYGLEVSDDGAAALVELRRSRDGWVVNRVTRVDRVEDLAGLEFGGRLAVLMPDEDVMYRRLELPRTDDSTLKRMVDAQAQSLLPQTDEPLDWAWLPLGGTDQSPTRPVLLGASRREAIRRVRDQIHGVTGASVDVVLGASAVEALCRHGGVTISDAPTALVRVAHGSTLLSLFDRGRVVGAASVDQGLAQLGEGEAPVWAREVAESIGQMTDAADFQSLEQCTLLGDATHHARLAGVLSDALRCPIQKEALSEQMNPSGVPGFTEATGAIGAALALAIGGSDTGLLYVDSVDNAPSVQSKRGFRPGLVIGAAVWALLMLVGLYQLDRYQATQLESALEDARRLTAELGGLDGRLKLLNYIETHATTPALPLMQEVSELVPQGTILSDYSYDLDGRVRFSGYVSSASGLDAFTAKLTASPLFKNVDVPTAKYNERSRRWDYQINALAVPLIRYSVHLAQTKKPAPQPKPPDPPTPAKPAPNEPESGKTVSGPSRKTQRGPASPAVTPNKGADA